MLITREANDPNLKPKGDLKVVLGTSSSRRSDLLFNSSAEHQPKEPSCTIKLVASTSQCAHTPCLFYRIWLIICYKNFTLAWHRISRNNDAVKEALHAAMASQIGFLEREAAAYLTGDIFPERLRQTYLQAFTQKLQCTVSGR